MGLGQSMITVLFFALLTLMFLNAVQLMNKADRELMTVNAYKTAADLGQSLMAEIRSKKFDKYWKWEASKKQETTTDINVLTDYSLLGPEDAGEVGLTMPDRSPFASIGKYNDVDDYNGYSRLTDSINGLAPFRDSVIVYYVQTTNPITKYNSRWWYKMIEVWVTQDDYLSEVNRSTGVRTSKWIKFYSVVGAFVRYKG